MVMYMNQRIVGCGERTVVLSHGYGGSQAIWDKLLPQLTQTNKVVLFDWDFSGVGEEEEHYTFSRYADELIAVMDEMEVRGAVYMGHSMAGMIGCIASIRRPDLFTHLVLVGASPRYINSEDYEGGFDEPDIDVMLSAISSDFLSWAKGFVPLVVGSADPSNVDRLARSFFAMDPRVAHAVARMIFLGDQRDVLERVAVPCTVVHASGDFAAPPCVGRYMQRRMTRCAAAVMETVDSVGHFPQLVAPEEMLRILYRVIGRCAGDEDEQEATVEGRGACEGSITTEVEVKGDIDVAT